MHCHDVAVRPAGSTVFVTKPRPEQQRHGCEQAATAMGQVAWASLLPAQTGNR